MDKAGVRIGEAAALYGLAPSTLRWWEEQGVLTPPARADGRRHYREEDLRRIGLAYLCCVTGRMPLSQASVATSGTAPSPAWQATITGQVERLATQIAELEAARAYLSHLLLCADDDPSQCPHLDGELSSHTPRGRFPDPQLTAAARNAAESGYETPRRRYENPSAPQAPRCGSCANPLPLNPRGRPRTYCSSTCRQRAYRARSPRSGD
ncbi:helix-turn-helix domain-containing protein [Amycolatopsis magusensis]|uniref:DNA-binding transcriptional MerR regulator n=1 Tax=Amycolatopsis magusensis TaxID=882444 RepID=A0ABS4Q4W6_9PSEU|nr:MerR family transcriptional regulator [Amycolatopsis magusensis]MBP2186717.1 DNA-binding transcriptional MerR regulator [Amycolatopsis magusensis]